MANEHDHARTCPTCGAPVRVVSSDEGTSFFAPMGAMAAIERAERLAELWKRSPDTKERQHGADLAAILKPLEPLPDP